MHCLHGKLDKDNQSNISAIINLSAVKGGFIAKDARIFIPALPSPKSLDILGKFNTQVSSVCDV